MTHKAFPNPYPAVIFGRSRYDAYLNEIAETKANVESAWREHYEAVYRFKASKMWEAFAPNWEAFLALPENKDLFFAASTYRQIKMNIPIATLAATVANTTLTREEMNKLSKKLNEVIPAEERAPMKLSVLALAYAYEPETAIPGRDVLSAAYEVLKEERDNNTLSVNGESFDMKSLGQREAIREKLLDNIQAHASQSKRAKIKDLPALLALLPSIITSDSKLPSDKARNFRIVWEE